MTGRVTSIAAVLSLAGCAPAVELAHAPRVSAPNWGDGAGVSGGGAGAEAASGDFWSRFGDPRLPALIADARVANPTVAAAVARVAQARGAARIARAPLLPQVDLAAGLNAARYDNFSTAQYSLSGTSAGLSVGYDLDLFGGLRAGRRAALERWRAARWDAEAAALGVEAEVGRSYVLLRAGCERLKLLDRTIANQRELLRIIDVRTREGAAIPGERGVQAVELRRREAERSAAQQGRRGAVAAIAALTGREAPGYDLPCTEAGWRLPTVDPGQPSDLLFRRPDIRSFEAQLAAARGDVQQARAAFLPSLRIDAGALGQSATIGGALGSTLRIGAGLLAPIFQGGRLRGGLEQASGRQKEVAALYRQGLLTGLREAVAALVAIRESGERERLYASAIADARRAVTVARRRYVEGETDLSGLLDAERGLFQAEDGAVEGRRERGEAAITLFQSLGGAPDRAGTLAAR